MIRDNAAHFTISKDLLYHCGIKFEEGLQFTLDSDLSLELFNDMEKPTVIAYGDYDVVIGFSSKYRILNTLHLMILLTCSVKMEL